DHQCGRNLPARRLMTDRKLSTLCRATSVVPSKVNVARGQFAICSSSLSKTSLTLSSSALLIVSLQSLQCKISILNHGVSLAERAGVGRCYRIILILNPGAFGHHHKNKTRDNSPVLLSIIRCTTCSRRKTCSYPIA